MGWLAKVNHDFSFAQENIAPGPMLTGCGAMPVQAEETRVIYKLRDSIPSIEENWQNPVNPIRCAPTA